MRKLYIYDKSDGIDRRQANGRFDPGDDIVTLAVENIADLTQRLNQLAAANSTFDRLLIQTHGNSGKIFFGNTGVGAVNIGSIMAGSEVMFPAWTRVYFDGCNVADGDAGWAFLEEAGKVLLKKAGGITYGWTSLGFGLPGWLPFLGGHTVHPWGDTRYVTFAPGGTPSGRDSTSAQARRARQESGCVGFKC